MYDKLDRENDLSFLTSHGHTPHMIHPYTSDFIYLADIVPTSNHIHIPWVMGYDISPGVSVVDKERILEFIIKNDLKVMDASAISLARENNIPILVFSIHKHGNFAKVLIGKGPHTKICN